jgi:hypothetical protein
MNKNVFAKMPDGDLCIGLFDTDEPKRFGVYKDGTFYDKKDFPQGSYKAWGVLSWSAKVAKFWKAIEPLDYNVALVLCRGRFEYNTWNIGEYHDNANMELYMWMMAGLV